MKVNVYVFNNTKLDVTLKLGVKTIVVIGVVDVVVTVLFKENINLDTYDNISIYFIIGTISLLVVLGVCLKG